MLGFRAAHAGSRRVEEAHVRSARDGDAVLEGALLGVGEDSRQRVAPRGEANLLESARGALVQVGEPVDAARERVPWFTGHEVGADVLDGVKFKDGIKVTDDDTATQDEKVAA